MEEEEDRAGECEGRGEIECKSEHCDEGREEERV